MNAVFADTLYWIALINSRDQWHQRAISVNADLTKARLITTDSVLTELANFFAEYGVIMRRKVALGIRAILDDEQVEVLSETRQTFLEGLTLYESRSDKAYSLTDCIAMNVMRKRGITDVLTHDTHFTQEGFHILL
jgi:predicted nucleic acid-binding protein